MRAETIRICWTDFLIDEACRPQVNQAGRPPRQPKLRRRPAASWIVRGMS